MSTSPVAVDQQKLLFEQYKLAVEMAAGNSARRQAANNFFIGLVSGFGVLNSLIDKSTSSLNQRGYILSILPICLCVVWWLTIYSYRRLNKIKWKVIYDLESNLPAAPFTSEEKSLGKRSFALTKIELAIPLLVGLVFLLLMVRSLLER